MQAKTPHVILALLPLVKLKPFQLLSSIYPETEEKNFNFSPSTPKMDDPSSSDSIIETREELMVSPSSGENPLLRNAYFLNPCKKKHHFLPPHFPIFTETSTKLPIEVRYNGWRAPPDEWKIWVEELQPRYEYIWSKAGIHDAIKASTFEIKRDDDLILELSKRWSSKTNTFVFPWGEATITLEDLKFCWGYSVLGDCVTNPIVNTEEEEVEEELLEARRMFNSSKAKKVPQKAWMMHFMGKKECKVEHEAFLVYWLSRFVFPSDAFDIILKSVIPIAIHLARGIRIALAPAVLATIYRDLTVLNTSTVNNNLSATIWAPFQLVQIWTLERFPALRPFPYNARGHGLHRIALWDGLKLDKNKNLKKVLDSEGVVRDGFLWRPYENSSPSLVVYNEKDMWVCDNPSLDEELESFARCLRVCQLVGMGCKEKYHPHRVAMQFGMDQDIPGVVARCKKDPWMSYSRPASLIDTNLCIRLSSSQPDVTSRYYDWWKKCKEGHNTVNGDDHCQVDEVSSSSSSEAKCSVDDDDDDVVVVENGKALYNPEFGVFPSTSVGDETVGSGCGHEAEIKSPFCDKDGASDLKGESVSTLTVDMALDLENRIEKLESVVAKLKAARYGVRNAEENVGQLPPNGANKPETSRFYCRRRKRGLKEDELEA